MNFMKAEDTENYMERRVSENGVWEFGIRPVLFGYRVAFGPNNTCFYSYDYCCADKPDLLKATHHALLRILESFPEEATEHEILAELPEWNRRPIDQDDCFENLLKLYKEKVG